MISKRQYFKYKPTLTKNMKNIYLFKLSIVILFSGFTISAFSQGVVISNNSGAIPDNSAMLEIRSTTQGLLIPRMTTAERTSISAPVAGLLVYDTDFGAFYLRGSSAWIDLSSEIWTQSGSNVTLTDPLKNVGIGTTPLAGNKFVIKADASKLASDPLLEIQDKDGGVIMSVTSEGVRVYVKDMSKGVSGGFAVGRYTAAKDKGVADLFVVTEDSTRVYTEEAAGVSGGFAVGRYTAAKGPKDNYLYMVPENYFIGHQAGSAIQLHPAYTGIYNTFFGYQSGLKDISGSNNVFIGYKTGYENTIGKFNVFLGNQAGNKNVGSVVGLDTLGSRNVFLGYQAGFSNTQGNANVLLGYQAGYKVTTAGNNISIGSQAGYRNTNNSNNIFLGLEAGYNHIGTGADNSANNNIYIGLKAGYGPVSGGKGINNVFIGTESGKNNDTGSKNVFLGFNAGLSNTEGELNVFLGESAGYSNTSGNYNVLLGYRAGYENETGISNTFLGHGAGYNNIDGSQNVFIGPASGMNHRTNSSNVYIGYETGRGADAGESGAQNVFVGREAGRSIVNGNDNVLLGYRSGYSLTSAGNNISIGSQAGYRNANNSDNIFFGRDAGYNHVGTGTANQANNNIFIGLEAGYGAVSGESGENNIFMGTKSGYSNSTGDNNIFLGTGAGERNLIGHSNIFMGNYAGQFSTNSTYNILMGYKAGNLLTTASFNVYLGYNSGTNTTTGSENVFIGYASGEKNTLGYNNTFIGKNAGKENTESFGNTYVGTEAGELNTEGGNTHLGMQAGQNSSGVNAWSQTFVGYQAGQNTTGQRNTFVGMSSGNLNGTGQDNVYMGQTTGYNTPDGDGNVYIGMNAGYGFTAGGNPGDDNVYLGKSSGYNATGSSNVFIGKDVGFNETGSSLLYIDNSSTITPLIYGDFSTDALRIHGTLTFNEDPNSIIMPNSRGTTGQVLATNATTGQAYWTSLTGESTNASNGLNLEGNYVELGGALNETTTITQGNYDMVFSQNGTGNFKIRNSGGDALEVYHSSYLHGLVIDPWNSVISAVNIDPTEANQSIYFGRDVAASQWIFQSGKVGIGTTSPATETKLHVLLSGTSLASQFAGTVACFQQNSGTDNWSRISVIGGNAGASVVDFGDAEDQDIGNILYSHGSNYMSFTTNNSEQMRISSAGNVGIGTDAPSSPLHIKQKGTTASYGLRFETSLATTEDWYMYMNASDDFVFRNDASDYITFQKNTGNVGIGTTSPVATLDVNGSVAMNLSTITADYTITDTDGYYTILCNNTSAAITVTLPTASANNGRILIIKRIYTYNVTIEGEGSETIDGALNQVISTQYKGYVLQSNGTAWFVISEID